VELLLDTRAFLWWLTGNRKLGPRAQTAIGDPANAVYVSSASAWEIAIKRAKKKLIAPGDIQAWIADEGFHELPITVAHAIASAELPRHHKDPFDRLLVAQAEVERFALVTDDKDIAAYGITMIDASA
jgi:PIN domain nuclease of toxin-antitoxin system